MLRIKLGSFGDLVKMRATKNTEKLQPGERKTANVLSFLREFCPRNHAFPHEWEREGVRERGEAREHRENETAQKAGHGEARERARKRDAGQKSAHTTFGALPRLGR